MKKTFNCKNCELDFTPHYRITENYIMQFCSKSCKQSYQNSAKAGFHNKSELERFIVKTIISKNRYLTVSDVVDILKISNKTLSKFRISIIALNKQAGMKKPKSVFEGKILDYISLKYKFELEKVFSDCLSPKGFPLRFDFYIPSINTLIEADGTQHYDKKNPNYSEYQSLCDAVKNEWCIKNKINLIRIPYNKKCDYNYIKSFLNF